MKVWSDDKVHALNPMEVAELFDLADTTLGSCETTECIRSAKHRGRCANAEDFKRALSEVRRVDEE